jgi:hypothetical protein
VLPEEEKEDAMLLFVKRDMIHHYPVPKNCNAVYEQEQLRDTVPHDARPCPYCMNIWPEGEERKMTA